MNIQKTVFQSRKAAFFLCFSMRKPPSDCRTASLYKGEISAFLKENLDENSCDISVLTDHNLACAAFNLWDGLLDPRHQLPTKEYDMFTLVKDYGVRTLSYGNSSGGVFNGLYRSFIIDVKGNTEIIFLMR